MDVENMFYEGGIVFLITFVMGTFAGYSKKKETGEFDWKEFGKFVIYGFTLAVAAAFGSQLVWKK